MNAITGGKHKPQNSSGLGGLASSFLGGGSQGGHSGSGSGSGGGSGGGFGGLAGQLVGSLLDGGKPSKPQQQQSSQQSSSGQSGGLMGFLGGHHGSSVGSEILPLPLSVLNDTRRTRETAMVTHPADMDLAAEATQARPLQHHTNPPASTAQTNLPLQAYSISCSHRLLIPTVSLAYSIWARSNRCRLQTNTEVQACHMVRAHKRTLEQAIAMLLTTTHRREAWLVQPRLEHRRMDSSIRHHMKHMLNSINRLVNLPFTTVSTITSSPHKIHKYLEATSTAPNKVATIHKNHPSPAHRPVNPPHLPMACQT